jgi:hypothetical protein
MRLWIAPAAAIAASALAACNGTSASSPFFPSSSSYVRVVHGSPDAGNVDVLVDGKVVQSGLAYGTMSAYASLKTGAHTMDVYSAGDDSGKPLTASNFSINSGQDTSIVLTGELHPSYAAKRNLTLRLFTEQPYDTPSGGAAVDVHHASLAALDGLHLAHVSFGYSLTSPPGKHALGTPQPYGGATGPVGLPSDALNLAITFYARDDKSATITPNDAMSGCTGLPCNGQSNLSLYYVDGPAASKQPTNGYPSYFSANSMADFIGVFDANALIQ